MIQIQRHRSIQLDITGNSEVGTVLPLALSDLPNVSQYALSHTSYRISSIRLQFIPQKSTEGNNDRVLRYLDAIDQINPSYSGSGPEDVLQHQSCEAHFPGKSEGWTRIYTPRFLDNSILTTGFISLGSPNIPHYGYKYYYETENNGDWNMHLFITYYITLI